MNQALSKTKQMKSDEASPMRILQRKCACGNHTAAGGICEECANKNAHLQRRASNESAAGEAPPIVHDVLRSAGQPLDSETRAFFEPRFGRDFSAVRVHTNDEAARSAQAVGALAYTVGRDVVFGQGQYAPSTTSGRHLLAHEFAHTIQQSRGLTSQSQLRVDDPSSAAEQEATETADAAMNGRAPELMQKAFGLARQTPAPAPHVQPPSPPPPKTAPPKAPATTGSFSVAMTPFTTGVSGTIAFNPDAKNCPVCKLIRLVQIVRVFEKPGQEYHFTGTEAPREKVKTAEDKAKGVKAGYFVDHLAANCSKGNKCSLYYRDHAPNSSKSQDGSNDGTTPNKASLWDKPQGDADDVFEFETCARCADPGSYLRCVDWGFTADSAGKATLSSSSEHAQPTATFNAAIASFNAYYANPS